MRKDLRLTPARIDIDFTDDGDPAEIDPGGVVFPDVPAARGRGLAVAKAELDVLSSRREAGRNRWAWVHRLPTG